MINQANWYRKFRSKNKHQWWPDLDEIITQHLKSIDKLEKQTEKTIYSKIKKEIKSKKYDDVVEMKALRFSSDTKKFTSKYIDLRFKDLWEDMEDKLIFPFMDDLKNQFIKYYEKNLNAAENYRKLKDKLEQDKAIEEEKKRGW